MSHGCTRRVGTHRAASLDWLDGHAHARRAAGLRRTLTPRAAVLDDVIDLASNDYLGLGAHPQVIAAAAAAARRWGAGSTGSRLVTGTTELHSALERSLAEFCGQQRALVFSSGYTANLGVVAALTGRDALIVSDGGSHASLVDACRLSRAEVIVTERGNVEQVRRALAERHQERAVVLCDAVYSIDGALAPIAELYAAAHQHGAVLIADEAHGVGVRGTAGQGYVHELGLAGREDLIVTATLSKALGSQGGVVLGSSRVIDHLVDTARTFIFDTGLNPPAVGAADAALGVLRRHPEMVAQVRDHARRLAAATGASAPDSAVVSVVLGEPQRAVAARDAARERGVAVGCFRPPTVPEGTSRLRLTARAGLSEAQLARAEQVLREVIAEVGGGAR